MTSAAPRVSLRTALILEELYAAGMPRDSVDFTETTDRSITLVFWTTAMHNALRDLLSTRGFYWSRYGNSQMYTWTLDLKTTFRRNYKETNHE